MDPVDHLRAVGATSRFDSVRSDAPRNEVTPEAAREFEAFLLHRMLKSATRPVGGPHLLDGGPAGRLFRDLFLEEAARLAVAGRGLGFVESVTGETETTAKSDEPQAGDASEPEAEAREVSR